MKSVFLLLASFCLVLVLAALGYLKYLSTQIPDKRTVRQTISSPHWVAQLGQSTNHLSPPRVSSTWVRVYAAGSPPASAQDLFAVLDDRPMQLHWDTPQTLRITCNECDSFLKYDPPAGLTVTYNVTLYSKPAPN